MSDREDARRGLGPAPDAKTYVDPAADGNDR